MTTITQLPTEIPRDRYGRPLIVPVKGGKPVPYTRATTYAGSLDDTYGLRAWDKRMVAAGLAKSPALLLAATAAGDDRRQLDPICERAHEAGGGNDSATIGTAIHALCERLDRGENIDLDTVQPPHYVADLEAYRQATKNLQVVRVGDTPLIEQMMVLDTLQVAGTPDRVVTVDGMPGQYIADIKTGGLDFAQLKISMQLAIYAHSVVYDWHADPPQRMSVDIDQERALVIHLPAGTGTCELLWIDIATGWQAIPTATQVRRWRGMKKLVTPFDAGPTVTAPTLPTQTQHIGPSHPSYVAPEPVPALPSDDLANLIAAAANTTELRALWDARQSEWQPRHTQLAAARKALLTGGLA